MTDRIAVNCRALTKPEGTGVARYTRRLLAALVDRDDEMHYLVIGTKHLPTPLVDSDRVTNATEPAWAHSGLLAHLWEQIGLPAAVRRHDPDLLFTPAGHAPVLASIPQVATIHDLSPVVHPEWFSPGYAALYRLLTPLSIRASDEVIAVSRFTAEAVRERYDPAATVHTVHNGVTAPSEGESPLFEVPDRYFLFVGAANPRKNLGGLLRAYRAYRDNCDDPAGLVLVGPDRDIFETVDAQSVEGVVSPGYVSDAELGWLYRHALGLVYPSLYEGFGFPILEAMSVGTPVITSDRGAMAEVAENAAVLVDPEEVSALARAITRIATERDRRATLSTSGRKRAEQFDWDRTAEGTARVFRRALDG